jgi:hypothetical protein
VPGWRIFKIYGLYRSRGITSMAKLGPYLKLLLEDRKGRPVSVVVQESTAQYFGWDKAFRGFFEPGRVNRYGQPVAVQPRLWFDPRIPGGTRVRICRSADRNGYPAKMTHCFRMQGAFGNRHLKQLAVVAGDRFEWMETRSLKRRDRVSWLA